MATADTVRDRRQARDERGIRSSEAAKNGTGERLPSAPRQRRPALAALAILLIVGGAAIAGLLAMRMDERAEVIVASTDIPQGTEITADMLTTTRVASEGTLLIPASQAEEVIGMQAQTAVKAGQLVDTEMVGNQTFLREGWVAVGAALAAGRLPDTGLEPGDVVQLVQATEDGDGEVIVDSARVLSSRAGGEAGSAGAGSATVSIVVKDQDAPEVAGVAAANQLSIVLVSRGQPFEAADSDEGSQDEGSQDDGSGDGSGDGESQGEGE